MNIHKMSLGLATGIVCSTLVLGAQSGRTAVTPEQEHNHEVFDLVEDANLKCDAAWNAHERLQVVLHASHTEKDRAKLAAAFVEADRLSGEIWLHLGVCRDDLRALRSTVTDAHAPKASQTPPRPPR